MREETFNLITLTIVAVAAFGFVALANQDVTQQQQAADDIGDQRSHITDARIDQIIQGAKQNVPPTYDGTPWQIGDDSGDGAIYWGTDNFHDLLRETVRIAWDRGTQSPQAWDDEMEEAELKWLGMRMQKFAAEDEAADWKAQYEAMKHANEELTQRLERAWADAASQGDRAFECRMELEAVQDELEDFRGCPADLNGDGVVNGRDLAMLQAAWGECE